MTKNGKGFGKNLSLNHPTTEINKTQKSFINDCFELTIFCVENHLIDAHEMADFAARLDGEQLGDNDITDAKIKSSISNGCDPRVASKLAIILTYLEISELTDRINKQFVRRKQTEFNTARMIAVVVNCFMLHDDFLDDELSNEDDDSEIDIDRLIIQRLKKSILNFA